MCSDAPDTSGMNKAAEANANISKEALDFYKQAYADQAPARERAAATGEAVSQQQLASMKQNDAISKDYWDYQKGTFRPLEEGVVADAQKFDTPERREAEAAAAGADVSAQAAIARGITERNQASMGVNPNSGRAEAMAAQGSVAEAAMRAGAMNTARKNVELQGYARKMDAANLGRNLASSQATSAGVAINAGNSATANANSAVQVQQQGTALMQQGFNTGIQGNQSAGNLYGQSAQIEASSGGGLGSTLGGLGQLAGGAAALKASSKKLKTKMRPVSAAAALHGIKALNVEQWDYKPGAGDGGTHLGPYAEDVQRELGEEVAPGGKMLNMEEMGRANTMAIEALMAKADNIERLLGAAA